MPAGASTPDLHRRDRAPASLGLARHGFIATVAAAAYLRLMPVTRLIRLAIMLAVLLAPLAMIAGVPAQAAEHHAAASQTLDHCAGLQKKSKELPLQGRDCMMACAAIIPICSEIDAHLPSPAAAQALALATSGHGLEPEAATPPPRLR